MTVEGLLKKHQYSRLHKKLVFQAWCQGQHPTLSQVKEAGTCLDGCSVSEGSSVIIQDML